MIKSIAVFLAVLCVASSGSSAAIRLAVLPEDEQPQTRLVADLLVAKLSSRPDIEWVERAAIDRVLAEQELTGAGLVNEGILLGRLLDAQGIVFVRYDDFESQWTLRLVESRQGFLAGFHLLRHDEQAPHETLQAATAMVTEALPKIREDASEFTLVSLIQFDDVTWERRHARSARELSHDVMRHQFAPQLIHQLCRLPGILVLERQRLGDLLDEANLIGAHANFSGAGMLLEGDLGVALGTIGEDHHLNVVLTVRIRDSLLQELALIEVNGDLENLPDLYARAISATCERILEMRDDFREASSEALSMLQLAERDMPIWVLDSAYAMNPTNAVARDTLIRALVREGVRTRLAGREYPVADHALARAERICREHGLRIRRYISGVPLLARFDPESHELLAPLREALRADLERVRLNFRNVAACLYYSRVLFRYPRERLLFTWRLFERVETSPALNTQDRDFMLALIVANVDWIPELFEELADHPSPFVRYYANSRLARLQPVDLRRRAFAMAALEDLQATVAMDHVLGTHETALGMSTLDGPPDAGKWLAVSIRHIQKILPEKAPMLNAVMFGKLEDLLHREAYLLLLAMDAPYFLEQVSPAKAVRWIDALTAKDTPVRLRWLRESLITLRRLLLERHPEIEDVEAEAIRRRVLLTPSGKGCSWNLNAPEDFSSLMASMKIFPERLRIDGDTLWIAFSGEGQLQGRNRALYPLALLHYDLISNKIISARYGHVPGSYGGRIDWGRHNSIRIFKTNDGIFIGSMLLRMFFWNDYLVVSHGKAGILLFPKAPTSGWASLDGIKRINEETGLLVNDVRYVTGLDDHLYVGLSLDGPMNHHDVLVKWDYRQQNSTLLLDLEHENPELGSPEFSKRISNLSLDPSGRLLRMSCALWKNNEHRRGWGKDWNYDPVTQRWEHVIPDQTERTPERQIIPEGLNVPFGSVRWNSGIIAITGFDPDWRLEYFAPTTVASPEPEE